MVCQSLIDGFAFLFEERLNNAYRNVYPQVEDESGAVDAQGNSVSDMTMEY